MLELDRSMLLFRFLFSLSALLPKGKNLPELMLLLLGVMLPASRLTRPGETTPRGEGAPVDFGAVMGEVITSSPLVERDGIMLDASVYEIQAGYGVVLFSAYILF